MNNVFSYTSSFTNYFSLASAKNAFTQLSASQKKVAVISALAMSIFALYVVFRGFFNKPNHPGPNPNPNPATVSQKPPKKPTQVSVPSTTVLPDKYSNLKMNDHTSTTHQVSATQPSTTHQAGTTQQDTKPTKDPKTNLTQIFSQSNPLSASIQQQLSASQFSAFGPSKVQTEQQKIDSLISSKLQPANTRDNAYNELSESFQKINILDDELAKGSSGISSFDLQENLKKNLLNYPDLLRKYLLKQDAKNPQLEPSRSWIVEQLIIFGGLIDRFSSDNDFIGVGLASIDEFLESTYFDGSNNLQSHNKANLIVYQEMIDILKKYTPSLTSIYPGVAANINAKLAVLPDDLNDLDDGLTQTQSQGTSASQNPNQSPTQSPKLSPTSSPTLTLNQHQAAVLQGSLPKPVQSLQLPGSLKFGTLSPDLIKQALSPSSNSKSPSSGSPTTQVLIPTDLTDDATPADIDQYIRSHLQPARGPAAYQAVCNAYTTIEILEKVIADNTYNDTTMTNVKAKLDKMLMSYPKLYVDYLATCSTRNNTHVFAHERTLDLGFLLDRQSGETDFVLCVFTQIDQFLENNFFHNSATVDETRKHDLIVLNEYFDMVNKHYPTIQNLSPELALRLKIKLANLPLSKDVERSSYSNIYLSETEQVQILKDHFQKKEDAAVNQVLGLIYSKQITNADCPKLAKCLSDESHLSDQNRDKLRAVVASTYNLFLDDCNYQYLANLLTMKVSGFYNSHSEMTDLHNAAKAKHYFAKQVGLKEEEIHIPRWYHTTQINSLISIINSGLDHTRHAQAFQGAWVSNQREQFGNGEATFVFNHQITKLDPNVFIGFEKGQTRWRGFQRNDVHMVDPKTKKQYLVIISLKADNWFKTNKQNVQQTLNAKKVNKVTFMSNEQLEYLQKGLFEVIGNPNLTSGWWGKANEDDLVKV